MTITRREAIQAAALSACALGISTTAAAAAEKQAMPPLDYGLSFLCCTAKFNSVRFWVESRTRIIDDNNGSLVDFHQCASCKSENTFGKKDLFYADNYDFLPIWGGGKWLIFRRTLGLNKSYRKVSGPEEVWGVPELNLREAPKAVVIDTWEAIRDATAAAIPIVSQTEIANPETRLRAIIECPVKTINISHEKKMFQVDTGPIGFPDLSRRTDPLIDCLRLAFVAFNAPGFADFIAEQEAQVPCDGGGAAEVYHYTKPFSLPTKNRLLALRKT
ncbi:MAG TPA: hypothetical protein VMZ06_07325 [Candidatus Bathyarchaeia archaeon]|nr:hypothetical protein [Candidatus Bathyarchaeia archaeon]